MQMGSPEFPSDVIFEILTRTSLRALDACKCVCKEWKQLIEEASFMPLFCKRTNTLSGFYIQDMRHLEYPSMFASVDQSEEGGSSSVGSLPRDMRIVATCNQGILCCVRRRGCNYRYYVCKPTTQQWQSLPNPKLRYETVAEAIRVLRSRPLRFKLVRLSKKGVAEYPKSAEYLCFDSEFLPIRSKEYYKYRCEIFDSEAWAWRETQDMNLPHSELIMSSSPSVFASSSFHWLTTDDNILAFHEANESFHKLPLPEPVHGSSGCQSKQLVGYQGRLGLTCLTEEGNIELWVTKDEAKNQTKWGKKMVVSTAGLERSVTYPSPAGFYNAEIVLLKAFNEVVFYKLQDCSFSKVKLDHQLMYASEIFQFRSDSEPVEFRRTIA